MGSDLLSVVRFWAVLFLLGSAAFPLARVLFPRWYDRGYAFSKSIGLIGTTWVVYMLGTVHLLPFSVPSAAVGIAVLFVLGLLLQQVLYRRHQEAVSVHPSFSWFVLVYEEVAFFMALLGWAWIKAHEPGIRGLEKFMDFGFTQSILTHPYFPTPDMWYAGTTINYYYFGHIGLAILTKLSGLDLSVTFNLILAALFAFTCTMSASIAYQIAYKRKVVTALLGAFLVTLAGNMQTIYAFTKGYTGDAVKPFWELLWPVSQFWQRLPEGLNTYWYANATRFIPFSIHEFPSYSFVVSDIHGHVLSLPFVLLAVALAIEIFSHAARVRTVQVVYYGFLVGVLLMTNALDGPIYAALFVTLFVVFHWDQLSSWKSFIKPSTLFVVAAIVSGLPFVLHFESFVHGIAVNCPPAFLANSKIGPLLFEGVEKCQKSPLWMMALLWGFFVYCGGWLVFKVKSQKLKVKSESQNSKVETILLIFFFFSLALIIFPEFFYFKDIYPAHFRSNTMFKLGYQAFIMFSLVSAYVIVHIMADSYKKILKKIFFLLLLPQLFLVSIYPLFSVRSYFDSLRTYHGLYGFEWLQNEYADDFAALQWLKKQGCQLLPKECVLGPVIVEADGDSYTDYNHFSAFSGDPTIVGWAVHEWLWRGSYDVVSPRREEVRVLYESPSIPETRLILQKYHVRYIIVGSLERQKFKGLMEEKFQSLGRRAFASGNTVIYEVTPISS